MLLLAAPPVAQAQFQYATNNGAITLTNYTGTGGAVVISNFVTSIGYEAFYNRASLTSVTIPGSVTSIGGNAFAFCPSLTVITVDVQNANYSSLNGVLFDKSQNILIQCPGGAAGSYTIPINVTNIGNSAFAVCSSLTNVTIGTNVTSIGEGAFDNCNNLTGITIPNSVSYMGNDAFSYCTNLTNVTIGTNVTKIGNDAFNYCTSLTSITIPNSVTNIGNYAFCFCTSLANVTIPSGVTSIDYSAFGSCAILTGVHFRGNSPTPTNDLSVFQSDTNTTVYFLPETTGWGPTFDGRPTALWLPQVQTTGASFGVQSNQFGFNINWAGDKVVVVEACTNLANPVWNPVATNTLTDGTSNFSDPQWTNFPCRFYRLRSP